MKHLAAILCLILAGCNNAPPRGVVITPPVRSQALGPEVQRLHDELRGVTDSNDNIRSALDRAVEEARRLKDQKTATETELASQWKALTDIKKIVEAQKFQLQTSGDSITSLQGLVGARDMEVANLRTALNDANVRIADAATWQAKNQQKVAVYDWVMLRFYWILGISLALAIGYVLIRALKPAFLP